VQDHEDGGGQLLREGLNKAPEGFDPTRGRADHDDVAPEDVFRSGSWNLSGLYARNDRLSAILWALR
jgi:hypothetical protein